MLKQSSDFKKFFLLAFTRELIKNHTNIEIYSLEEIFEKKHQLRKREDKKISPVLKSKKPKVIVPIIKKETLSQKKSVKLKPSVSQKENKEFTKSILSKSKSIEFPFALGMEREVSKKPIVPIKRYPIKPPLISHPSSGAPIKEVKGPIKKIRVPLSSFEKSGGLEKFTISTDNIPGLASPIPGFKGIIPNPRPIPIDLGKLNPLLQDNNVREIICKGQGQNIIVRGNLGTKTTAITLKKEEIEDVINKFSQLTKIPVTEGVYKVIYGNLFLIAVISKAISTTFEIKKIPSAPISPPQFRRVK